MALEDKAHDELLGKKIDYIEKDVFNIAKNRIEKADTELEYDQLKMFK